MNTYTRGEKIDMVLANAKETAVKVLLIFWAFVTIVLGLGFAVQTVNCRNMEKEIQKIESEYNEQVDTVYVLYK